MDDSESDLYFSRGVAFAGFLAALTLYVAGYFVPAVHHHAVAMTWAFALGELVLLTRSGSAGLWKWSGDRGATVMSYAAMANMLAVIVLSIPTVDPRHSELMHSQLIFAAAIAAYWATWLGLSARLRGELAEATPFGVR